MIRIKSIYFLSIIFLVGACGKKTTSPSTTKYEENLESYRIRYEVKNTTTEVTPAKTSTAFDPKNNNNKALEDKLNLIKEKNKTIKYTQGYRIQVYSGSSKDIAEKAKETIYRISGELDPEVIYFPPNFKVKVGNYYDRLEAHAMLSKLKSSFPQAILIPERISIK